MQLKQAKLCSDKWKTFTKYVSIKHTLLAELSELNCSGFLICTSRTPLNFTSNESHRSKHCHVKHLHVDVQPVGGFFSKIPNSQFTVAETQIWGITELLEGRTCCRVRKSPAGRDSAHIIHTCLHCGWHTFYSTSQLWRLIRHTWSSTSQFNWCGYMCLTLSLYDTHTQAHGNTYTTDSQL